jgi:hypothetical protein
MPILVLVRPKESRGGTAVGKILASQMQLLSGAALESSPVFFKQQLHCAALPVLLFMCCAA